MNSQPDPYDLNTIHLSGAEFSRMRADLMAHMDAHPLPLPSPYAHFFAFVSPLQKGVFRPFVYACAVMLVVSTGTAAAAEGSLPGDLLYPIKIHVNEKVQVALARSPQAKATLAVKITDRRLTEVSMLDPKSHTEAAPTSISMRAESSAELQMNAANTKTEADISQDAQTRAQILRAAENAEKAIAELSVSNPEAAAMVEAKLLAILEEHSTMLANFAAAGDEEAGRVLDMYLTHKERAELPTVEAQESEKEVKKSTKEDTAVEVDAATTISLSPDADEDTETNETGAGTDSSPPVSLPPLPNLGL